MLKNTLMGRAMDTAFKVLRSAIVKPMPYVAGAWYILAPKATGTTQVAVADRIELYPQPVAEDVNFDRLAIGLSALAAGNAKVIVYSADPVTGRPANLLYETSDIDTNANLEAIATIAGRFQAGRVYWFGARFSGTPTYRAIPAGDMPSISTASIANANGLTCIRTTLAYATATPATWTWNDAHLMAVSCIRVGFRAA